MGTENAVPDDGERSPASQISDLVLRARAMLESADGADEAARLKVLEELHALLEEELDRNSQQGPSGL